MSEHIQVLETALREIIAINDEDPGTFRKRGGTRRGLSIVTAQAALKTLHQMEEALREIDSHIYNDNGDVTWTPLGIRAAVRRILEPASGGSKRRVG